MQNLIILALTLVGTYLFFDRLHYRKWMKYYQNEADKYQKDYQDLIKKYTSLYIESEKWKTNSSKLNKQKRFSNSHVNKIENSRNF